MNTFLDKKYFEYNEWLEDTREQLHKDLGALGIAFYDWYSDCCSSCGVHFNDQEEFIAYKLYKGGMNSDLEEDEDDEGNITELPHFRECEYLNLVHNFEDEKLWDVMGVLCKYFMVKVTDKHTCIQIKPKHW